MLELGLHSYCAGPITEFYAEAGRLIIGRYCSIAPYLVVFLGGNHRLDWISTYPFGVFYPEFADHLGHPATKGDVQIGNDVWIGQAVTILSGVTIGDGAVIAAGSWVAQDVGPYELWAGNPARFKKCRFSSEDIEFLCKLKWWNWPDERVKEIVPLLMSGNLAALRARTS